MSLSKKEKEEYLQNVVLKHFSFLKDAAVGAMLVDTDYIIRDANDLCHRRFGQKKLKGLSNVTVYDKSNKVFIDKTDTYGVSYSKYIETQNEIRLKLHEIVIKDKIPVQFICFMPHENQLRSLLVHYIPVFHDSGEVVAIQVLASEFSFWGIHDYLNFLDMQPIQQMTMLLDEYKLPVKLTTRQHEILFLLSIKVGMRQAAEILNISYGNLSKMVRENICPKFNINDANTQKLINLAIKLGYNKFIPQSLCRPCVIISDYTIWEKYFNN